MRTCGAHGALVALWIGITRAPVSVLLDPFPEVDLLPPGDYAAVAALS
jgi:hypothetical protein